MAKPTKSVRKESDDLIFAVCELFFKRIISDAGEKDPTDKKTGKKGRRPRTGGAASVAKEIAEEFGRPDLTRERIYPILWEAINRKFLIMNIPYEVDLHSNLLRDYNLRQHIDESKGDITVVNTIMGDITEHVNTVAADHIIKLIDSVQERKVSLAKAQGQNPENVRVHIGFGAGNAAEEVAKRLSTRASAKTPKLTLHALTSGGHYIAGQQKAPTTYFSYFESKLKDVEFVGMFTPTVVKNSEYEQLKQNPSVKSVYQRRDEIDIIVTSLGTSDDEHCLLREYYTHLYKERLIEEDVISKLEAEDWIGDVMFQPYSKTKPIVSPSHQMVTLFNFDELLKFSKEPGKHVVVTGGPCKTCQRSKAKAIRPLLENPELRLWTDLIIDRTTAEELLHPQK